MVVVVVVVDEVVEVDEVVVVVESVVVVIESVVIIDPLLDEGSVSDPELVDIAVVDRPEVAMFVGSVALSRPSLSTGQPRAKTSTSPSAVG